MLPDAESVVMRTPYLRTDLIFQHIRALLRLLHTPPAQFRELLRPIPSFVALPVLTLHTSCPDMAPIGHLGSISGVASSPIAAFCSWPACE